MTRLTNRTLTQTAFGAILGLALAGPAFAQSAQNQSSQGNGGSNAQSANGPRTQTQTQVMNQDKLRQQLTQAGFREVRILDAAYLVQAKTQDGNTVTMMIDPPRTGPQAAGAAGNAHGGSSSGGSSAASGGGNNASGGSQGR